MRDLESEYGRIRLLSFREKAELGRNAFCLLAEELLSQGQSEEEVVRTVESLLSASIAQDHDVTEQERSLYEEIFGLKITKEAFQELVLAGALEQRIRALDKTIDGCLSDEGKHAAVALAYCFLSCDETLTEKESWLFRKLLG